MTIMCPPGTDQTCRTAQKWHLLSPSLRQCQPLSHCQGSNHSTPQQFLQGTKGFGAFAKLARLPSRDASAHGCATRTACGLSPLERLPTELVGMVLDDADLSPKNVVAVGMCSRTLWSQTLSHIRCDVKKNAAPWAEKPLLCTGSWLTDLPPAIYERFPEEVGFEKKYEQHTTRRWYGPCPARVWNRSALSDYEDVEGQSSRQKWLDALTANMFGAELPPFVSGSLWHSLENVLERPGTIEHKDWILRDHTAQQYIRLQLRRSAGSNDAQAYVAGARWLSLDQALILRVSWGSVPDMGPEVYGDAAKLVRGPWAGHCFDMVEDSGDVHMAWKDVTCELVEEGKMWQRGKAARGWY